MVADRSSSFRLPTQVSAVKMSALVAVGIALVAMPAWSQGAMTPGGGAMTPQPRVAPAPQAPVVAPQAPIAAPQVPPQMPIAAPIPSPVQTGPTKQPGKANAQGADFVNVDSSNRMTTTPIGPDKPMPNSVIQPILGIDVVVKKQPAGSAIPTSTTDGAGQTTFRQLEPGNYSVQLPNSGPQGGAVSMTTFVNGKLASRTDFPVGSSVGTFAVASAKDTITLKFETNIGSIPAGHGGQGGGRYTFK